MGGFALLLIFLLLGEGLRALGVPLPGNVLGMLLLTIALTLGLVRRAWIESSVRFLLDHMALFFVPAGVGLIAHAGMLRGYWTAVSFAVLFSFVVVLYTSAFSFLLFSGKSGKPSTGRDYETDGASGRDTSSGSNGISGADGVPGTDGAPGAESVTGHDGTSGEREKSDGTSGEREKSGGAPGERESPGDYFEGERGSSTGGSGGEGGAP